MQYESTAETESKLRAGVRYRVLRMSFGRRLELTRRVREALNRLRFLAAGKGGAEDDADAALLGGEIDREYLSWGLEAVEGLEIDGEAATPELLIERGPEDLVREALEAVRRAAGLDEDERKNSASHSTLHAPEIPGGSATSAAA